MEIKIEDLLEDGLIDRAYTRILGYELNTLANELSINRNLDCKESEIVLGLGLMKSVDMINYLNNKEGNKVTYSLSMPTSEIKPVSLLHLTDNANATSVLEKHFLVIKMFPYHYDESTRELLWAVKEGNFDTNIWDKLQINSSKTFNQLRLDDMKVHRHEYKFMLSNQYNSAYQKFCIDNKLGFDPKTIHHPDVPHMTSCYIIKGILLGASDIYFDPKSRGIQVEYKILNDRIPDDKLMMTEPEIKSFLDEVLVQSGQEGKSRARSEETVDDVSIPDLGGFGHKYTGRVNLFRNGPNDSICIRVVDKTKRAIPMEESIVNPRRKNMLKQILENKQGIFIVAGGTGSGKSTTIGTCNEYMSRIRPYERIESVENPIEQPIEEISQLSLENSKATYDDVIEAFTRRNPDIIVLGEMNTTTTVRFGIDCAQQNKFLLSTLHTASAAKIPDRIRSMTIADPSAFEQFLAETRALMFQEMLKVCCPDCSTRVSMDDPRLTEDMHIMLQYYGYFDRGNVMMADPKPDCPTCEGRGFMIHKPVICVELCPVDDSLREDIQECEPKEIERILEAYMLDNKYTAVQDALEYMEQGKLDWMQIWTEFSLFQKVSKAKPLVNISNKSQSINRVLE